MGTIDSFNTETNSGIDSVVKRLSEESPEGIQAQARALEKQAFMETNTIKRANTRNQESILHNVALNYGNDETLGLAIRNKMNRLDPKGLEDWANRTVNNKNFSII